MDYKIKECLENKHHSYMLPFLWLHGEPKERVKEEILAIKNSGIREFCAESRPYERFCCDEWWDDFGFILKTARELDMGVWLLDDRAFPTGYANGYLEKEENAHLRKKLIREIQIDAQGPTKCAKFYVGGRVFEGESVINITACQYKKGNNGESLDYKTAVDLTASLSNGMVYWDVPKGNWRLCVTIATKPFAYEDNRFFYYIDMLSKSSCHAMIDAIYQPHYEHFKEYFGNTFRGFFSDEPGFLNVLNTYANKLGIMESSYPWSDELPKMISKSAGISESEAWLYLPALWEDFGEVSSLMRTHYMEAVTRLYQENFSYQLGDWCRDHGVMYIGHVIEDMGAHTRLGYGSGHYFRALDGQDMAGIDIVLMQDIPGISDTVHRAPLADGGSANPAFFRYTLPKLASSHSHIQPLKKNRAMCEIFGAFGWAEGLPFMKGLADIMLASGINYFVPHAFSPREEDEDCPPHFYNGGNNVLYPYFKDLIDYMSRCSHALSDSIHKADVAVFYNAEGEWSGEYKEFSEVCRKLTQNLIDFDIVPLDTLKKATVSNNRLFINNESYGALIVSGCEKLPVRCMEVLAGLEEKGLPVIHVDKVPLKTAEGTKVCDLPFAFGKEKVSLSKLPSKIRSLDICQLSLLSGDAKDLRFYHTVRDEKDIYLFSNEGVKENINVTLSLKQAGECLIYEPWENKYYKYSAPNGCLELNIEKGNMLFLIFGGEIPSDAPYFTKEVSRAYIDMNFDISLLEEGKDIDDVQKIAKDSSLFDITAPCKYPNYSGVVIYEGSFDELKGFDVLDLGQVGEACRVWLNGVLLGTRINAPYKFSMKNALKEKDNRIKIEVRGNLAHRRRDWLSSYMQISPTGLLGDVCFCKYR